MTSFWNSFVVSSSLITASELGDKTFFITSIMSMQKSRWTVFLASLTAMTAMNVLSIGLGLLTTNMPQWIIHYLSIGLFLLCGIKMAIEGFKMTETETIEEYNQAQKFVNDNEVDRKIILPKCKMVQKVDAKSGSENRRLGQETIVFTQVFLIIFLAEWGDKSQLSTILLTAKESIWAVGIGAFVGDFICISIAVLGARFILKIISVKAVTIIGGFVFVACAVRQFIA